MSSDYVLRYYRGMWAKRVYTHCYSRLRFLRERVQAKHRFLIAETKKELREFREMYPKLYQAAFQDFIANRKGVA